MLELLQILAENVQHYYHHQNAEHLIIESDTRPEFNFLNVRLGVCVCVCWPKEKEREKGRASVLSFLIKQIEFVLY